MQAQVSPVVRELGRFTCIADVDCIAQVLQSWQMLLQFDLYEVSLLTALLPVHICLGSFAASSKTIQISHADIPSCVI